MKINCFNIGDLISNHCEINMEIKIIGKRLYAFRVWLSKKMFSFAARLLMSKVNITITRDI